MENWKFNATYSGTPQGGIVSPLLANIYLHELDKFVETLKADFNAPPDRKFTLEYDRIMQQVYRLSRKIRESPESEKPALLAQWKVKRAEMMKTPAKSQTDKKLKYIRYADDFLLAVVGSKEDCVSLKSKLKDFIGNSLKMELSEEKTLITHSSSQIRFLGYDISVRRNSHTKKSSYGKTQRTKSYRVELLIPLQDKIERFMFDKNVIRVKNNKIVPSKRDVLSTLPDLEILASYNAEMRGICNYYSLAVNYYHLNYFSYLMEYSCLMTLASKYQTTISKIRSKFQDGEGGWCIPYQTKNGNKKMYFARHNTCAKKLVVNDTMAMEPLYYLHSRSTLEERLNAHVCELCDKKNSERYEIHHINKVKNLKGKAYWEIIMIAKKRKTLVVCEECHYKIHNRIMRVD